MTEDTDRPVEPRPAAMEIQGMAGPLDRYLVDQARKSHPTVSWWWGVRATEDRRVALCYVCDLEMEQWKGSYRAPRRVRNAIIGHRLVHRDEWMKGKAAQEATR